MNALDDSANTDRCTLYEDSANFLKDERFTGPLRRQYQTLANRFGRWTPRTQESNRKQAPQSGANVCRRRKWGLKKSPLLIAQDTQHKLGVAFSYLERNKNHEWLCRGLPLLIIYKTRSDLEISQTNSAITSSNGRLNRKRTDLECPILSP